MEQVYIRDGRAPIPKNPQTSRIMSRIHANNTKPELTVRKALWAISIKGYRLHWEKVPGKPDIAFPGKQIAIFINGCYWHQCPQCNNKTPKTNQTFWKDKFTNNKERDIRKTLELQRLGWKVCTLWECEIKKSLDDALQKIKNIYYS